jgi:hypothetical protein
MLASVFHLEENVCEKWKFEAILGKFIFGCGKLGKLKKKLKKKEVKTDRRNRKPTYFFWPY